MNSVIKLNQNQVKTTLTFKRIATGLSLAAALALTSNATAVTIDYASADMSFIKFDGAGNFSFTPAANSFNVTSGSAVGLQGDMSGSYAIGAITTIGGVSTASVTGSGTLKIHDGAFDLTGTLTWVDIEQFGTGGTLNTVGDLNLTGITYSGANADLVALKNAGSAGDVLTFQFIPAQTLTFLKANAAQTSFSGTIHTNVPDGGLTLSLLGFALVGIEGVRRKLTH